jgi:hypothetical protein
MFIILLKRLQIVMIQKETLKLSILLISDYTHYLLLINMFNYHKKGKKYKIDNSFLK